jgi:hypothetical protein
MEKIRAWISSVLIAVGVIYWLGLIGLIVATSPSGGGQASGAAQFDGGSLNIPGGRWFIHAACAILILVVAAWIKPKKINV